jgi:hypothetical protein
MIYMYIFLEYLSYRIYILVYQVLKYTFQKMNITKCFYSHGLIIDEHIYITIETIKSMVFLDIDGKKTNQ